MSSDQAQMRSKSVLFQLSVRRKPLLIRSLQIGGNSDQTSLPAIVQTNVSCTLFPDFVIQTHNAQVRARGWSDQRSKWSGHFKMGSLLLQIFLSFP